MSHDDDKIKYKCDRCRGIGHNIKKSKNNFNRNVGDEGGLNGGVLANVKFQKLISLL